MSTKKSPPPSSIYDLLANAHTESTFKGEKYFFHGDLCQMSTALQVANSLGLETGIEKGLPFVLSLNDYNCVKDYLISNRINGWWHYVSKEQYCKIK